MFEFAWWWLWILLPLPWLVRHFSKPSADQGGAALQVPFLEQMEQAVGYQQGASLQQSSRSRLILLYVIWGLLIGSVAKPQWLGEPIPQQLKGRDLMMAVDLSESMLEQDFEVNGRWVSRLAATRLVAGDFIQRREGDRVGLILFAEQAYQQAPLTHDRDTVKTLLDEAQVGLAGKATAIGDAIGLAVKRFKQMENEQRILILITDGRNTAGVLKPLQAVELAKAEGLKIYTIGVGGGSQGGLLGSFLTQGSDLDEKTLTTIAEETGGRFFRAFDLDELAEIYALLDELEPVEQDSEFFRPIDPLFQWPLYAAFVLALVLAVSMRGRN
ncbi:VWA domain-containing protein [Neptuniibacter sp.]|uniref:vWA domain-containing protein n=1 Tax=Neptuniibacter sp. TaxID=1962643 RepID=UPI002606D9BA|nr:VWA domain-containing protein [Neptuniibacter sp.]MCP4598042.1 VWA domain-containing protein [Neptuniibacter sp.]